MQIKGLACAVGLVVAAFLLGWTSGVLAGPTQFPVGLTKIVPERVQSGPVIFSGSDGKVYAIGISGNILRVWSGPIPNSRYQYARPIVNGNILAILAREDNVQHVVEFDTSGNIVWEYVDSERRFLRFHHDLERLPNCNTLIMCSRLMTVPIVSPKELKDDCVIEVSDGGEIIWEWQTAAHFDEFQFSDEAKSKIFQFGGDWTHGNTASAIPPNNLADPRFSPGNIIISYRFLNMIIVVDRVTGDIVWIAENITIGQHHSHMIPLGLTGAGNILVFDNGFSDFINNPGPVAAREYSRVVELDPLDQSVVYDYDARDSGLPQWWFFSYFLSSAQRLPNGNTLICAGAYGRIFEVAPDGEIVWEYISPIFAVNVRGDTRNNKIYGDIILDVPTPSPHI